ncbi:MAG: serine/threonine protein kinase [Planctomycetota bacterium]|nr:MAG: serine/threonine protein kinase [Planctomycetota bacterium]
MSDSHSMDATENFVTPTVTYEQAYAEGLALSQQYRELVTRDEVAWEVSYRLLRKLGSGGQGIVYLADRSGAFGVSFQLALKFFRPDRYPSVNDYRKDMGRLARLAMKMSRLQQDHLHDVYNVVEAQGIMIQAMEWVDGFDLRRLLTPQTLEQVRDSVDDDRWDYLNDVIVTRTSEQLRLKPGIAISILRECLTGIGALHREGLIHADLKPANIMVKRTGHSKIIDFGSAFAIDDPPMQRMWTPRYAAPEVQSGAIPTRESDLASLGYVLFEMLSGQYPFMGIDSDEELITAKKLLPTQLPFLLPKDVSRNATLMSLLTKLVAVRPEDRFSSAEDADLSENGAAAFEKELVIGDLSSEYQNELRLWLTELD